MSRSGTSVTPFRASAPWLATVLAVLLAIGSGILLAELLMSPPAGELRSLAAYLALSGTATVGAGWLVLRGTDHFLGLSIRAKSSLGGILAGSVALLNVFVTAQLMFISASHDLKLLIALMAFSAIVTVFFSLWVAYSVTSRLSRVTDAVQALAAGDYATNVDVTGRDEVSRLAEDVNTLAGRLRAAERERATLDKEKRDLTAAVSHDLRTPLASLRAMVEALDDSVVHDPGEVHRYYGTMRKEIERLSRMIDDLFELSRIDSGDLSLDRQLVALDEIAAEVVDGMQAHARQSDITLAIGQPAGSSPIPLDGSRMERAIANLVRNAIEHTPPGGRVDVDVRNDREWAVLTVKDSGDGIDPEDLPHIWERFYRAEKSRRRLNGGGDGAGIGLAIVRGIVEAHDGTVEATSHP
ncbi:MAG: sensor histidine kinase, partial [Dehalococcoidia bacterium]